MSERSSKLKSRLRLGETTFGAWLTVANPMIAEIMAGAGFRLGPDRHRAWRLQQ